MTSLIHLNQATEAPILGIDSLSVTFMTAGKRVEAVRQVSLELKRNEVLAIVGESGSGKSTLARAIVGIVTADQGKLTLDGKPLACAAAARSMSERRRIGMVFQDSSSAFNPRFTVRQIIEEPSRLFDHKYERHRAQELLDMVGLSSTVLERRPRDLSGGQRQRVGIARALAGRPDILICDEAVSALDVSVQAQILNLLSRLQEDNGLSLLFITHDLSVVSYLADRIAVMYRGKVLESGSADDIIDRPTHDYTRKLLAAGL